MKSIRRRLNRTLFLTLLLLTLVLGVVFHLAFRAALLRDFDSVQRFLAQVLSTRFEQLPDGEIEFDPSPEMTVRFADDRPEAEYFQIWDETGETVALSPSLGSGDLPRGAGRSAIWDLKLPDGRSGRAIRFEFEVQTDTEDWPPSEVQSEQAPDPARLVLVYARSRESMNQVLWLSALSFAALGVLLPLVGAVLLGRVVRQGLSPLDRLAEEIRSVEPGNLARRFSEEDLPDELLPIVGRVNDLLDRIEKAIEREKRFSSDVAHELRTPISELRTLAEVALHSGPGGGLDPSIRSSFQDALEIALQMERIVSALFVLMRARHGESKVELRELELAGLLTSVWSVWRGKAQARQLDCRFHAPDQAHTVGDETLVRAIFSNLLENAVTHAPTGGLVEGRLARESDRWILTIANTNDSLEKTDLPRLFEPFWQKDPSRSGTDHAGLGLATAAAFAELQGVQIRASLPKPDRFEIEVAFQAAGRG